MAVETRPSRSQTSDEKPDQTRDEKPDQTRDEKPDQTRDEKPDQTRDEKPDQTRDEKPDQTSDDEPDQTGDDKQDEGQPKKRSRLRSLAQSLPYAVGGIVLVLYFIWLMLEMSSHSVSGAGVPAAIFGAVVLGVLAGAASILWSRRRQ